MIFDGARDMDQDDIRTGPGIRTLLAIVIGFNLIAWLVAGWAIYSLF